MRLIRTVTVSAFLAAAAFEGSARAQGSPPKIVVDAPLECTDGPRFLAAVEARGADTRPRAEADAVTLWIRVRKVQGAALGELRMAFGGVAEEPRLVQGATCDEVVAALALTVTLALDRAPEAPRAPTAPAAPPPAPRPTAPVEGPRPTPSDQRTSFSVLAHARVFAGGDVGAVGALGLAFEWTRRVGSVFQPSLRLTASRTASARLGSDGYTDTLAWTVGELTFCPVRIKLGTTALRPCVAVEAGALSVSTNFTPTETLRPWVAPELIAGISLLSWGPVSVEILGGLSVPLVRDSFHFVPVGGGAHTYQAPPVLPMAGVNGGVTF